MNMMTRLIFPQISSYRRQMKQVHSLYTLEHLRESITSNKKINEICKIIRIMDKLKLMSHTMKLYEQLMDMIK